jgi:hypothetical protein
MVGCSNSDSTRPQEGSDLTAGGNGEFGESTSSPGSYSGNQYNSPTTQPSSSR